MQEVRLRLDPHAPDAIHGSQPEAFLLLLERRPQGDEQRRAYRFPHSPLPGNLSTCALGTRAHAAAEAARGLAFCGAGADISNRLLLRISARPLPASYRTGVADPAPHQISV